jgi:hypothetical protein
MFYVYAHINSITNDVFYIGKGCLNRSKSKSNRSKAWKKEVENIDYHIKILDSNLTEDQAFVKEKYYIQKFGRKDKGLGTLVNLNDGGYGGRKREEKYINFFQLEIDDSNLSYQFFNM